MPKDLLYSRASRIARNRRKPSKITDLRAQKQANLCLPAHRQLQGNLTHIDGKMFQRRGLHLRILSRFIPTTKTNR